MNNWRKFARHLFPAEMFNFQISLDKQLCCTNLKCLPDIEWTASFSFSETMNDHHQLLAADEIRLTVSVHGSMRRSGPSRRTRFQEVLTSTS